MSEDILHDDSVGELDTVKASSPLHFHRTFLAEPVNVINLAALFAEFVDGLADLHVEAAVLGNLQ